MRRTILSAAFLAAIIAGWLSAKPALATPTLVCSTAPCPVVYVVQNGLTVSNNGPSSCLSTANACALLSDAITQVTAGGTIIIIDDGVYFQSVPITKSVTIVGLMHPSIVPPSGSPAISIA